MTELASGAHLTTSRVSRLLRPLRNKCNTLAALPKPATASRVAYSKQSSNWDPDSRPPLAVLCSPAGAKNLTLDKHSAAEYELSRRIHAVCDAFKNIAHVAYGQSRNQRIPTLATMCTLVIGGNMPATGTDRDSVESDEDSTRENNQLGADEIYEAVPQHYRRYLIVSHALSMILCTCTHHFTLVSVLLDHSLSFGLVHESTHLLDIILAQAFLPSYPSCLPPVTHPAHTNYLLDLHSKWTTATKSGSSSGSTLFTTSTFCQAVLGTLFQSSSCNSHILWTSKVLNRLFHVVENCDLDSYITIIRALSQDFWEISGSSPDSIRDDAQPVMLRDKLSELMSNLFNSLFTSSGSHPSSLALSRIYAVIDMLYECYAAQLHHLRISTPCPTIDLPDIIIIFTTQIFVTFRNSIDNSDHLLAILDDSNPVPMTFSKLMEYFGRLRATQTFGDFMETFHAQLETYSSALLSESLFSLDASFWACALHHFQTSVANSQKGISSLITKHKQQLMDAVDAAEHRCFGRDTDSPVVSLSIRSNGVTRTKRGRQSGHWEWEDMVGSWIRRTPVHKKRKIDNDPHLHGSTTLKTTSRSTSASTSLSTCCRHLSTLSPTLSPASPSWLSEPDGSYYQDTDKENYPSSSPLPIKKTHPVKRRSSNFISILADAETNRIILHPKPRPMLKPLSFAIPEKYVPPLSSQEFCHAPRKQEQQANCKKTVTSASTRTSLPSDDSLDLFAYTTSSPARC